MSIVLRAISVYVVLLVLLRISGKRTFDQATTFDFVLLLIIAETTQQALLGQDSSVTGAVLLIITLIGFDILVSLLKERWGWLARVSEGYPLVIVAEGRLLRDRMVKERVDESDVLSAARRLQGLERLDQIKYAVLERTGGISIIPR